MGLFCVSDWLFEELQRQRSNKSVVNVQAGPTVHIEFSPLHVSASQDEGLPEHCSEFGN